jgi:hypothetical protein
LQRNSADLSLWVNGIGTTVTTNQTIAPDGTSTADTLTETGLNLQHFVSDVNASVTSGTTYTLSIFAKKGVGLTAPDLIQITGSGGAFGTTQYATFNIQAGSVNSSAGGTATIQSYGNGWYRLLLTVTATATTTTAVIVSFVGAAPTVRLPSYLGLITSDVFLWGGQIEAGSFPTSYIPTTTASVVRSADVCSITSIASFYGNGVGTILVGSQLSVISTLNGVCGFFTGTNQISIGRGGSVSRASTFGASPTLTINSGTLASTLFVKSAFAFNTNDAAFANNGVSAGTSTSVGIPSVSTFAIGSNGSQQIQSGTISEIKVFKKRLANAKLLTITV